MFLLLSYRMNPDYLHWITASSDNIASKRVDKELFRSKSSSGISGCLFTCKLSSCHLLLLSKLAVLSSPVRLPDHDDGELPCILLSTRASTLQLKTTSIYFPPGKFQDASASSTHVERHFASMLHPVTPHMITIRPQGARVFRSNSHHPARPS